MYRPNIEIDSEFKEKYPREALKFESWKTKLIPEDFLKLEAIIDLLRSKLKVLSRKADKAYGYFKNNFAKVVKLRTIVHAFHNFSGIWSVSYTHLPLPTSDLV